MEDKLDKLYNEIQVYYKKVDNIVKMTETQSKEIDAVVGLLLLMCDSFKRAKTANIDFRDFLNFEENETFDVLMKKWEEIKY